jgi:hypothetical protein
MSSFPTRRFTIREVVRRGPVSTVGPGDFVTDAAENIASEEVLRDPRLTLYCFDREKDAAIFVEVDDPEAVERHPFYYQGQVEHAVGVVEMPLPEFHRRAADVPSPPKGYVFVHSTGRCGSTLLSKALDTAAGVRSLSEPDDLTQMIGLREDDGSTDEWLKGLLRSSVRWRSNPCRGNPPDVVALKMRAEVMALADLYADVFPSAKHVFLYRDGLTWMRSIYRKWPTHVDVHDQENNARIQESWSHTLRLLREAPLKDARLNAVEIRILGWIVSMEGYFALLDAGVPLCSIRFEDLTASPVPVLKDIFGFCRIENVDWESIREVLGRDSQAGTVFARDAVGKNENMLTPALVEDVRRMIASRPRLGVPDVILPGTLGV